jgi:hypothetical protein
LALLVILLVSLYLFTIFRGAGKGPDMQKEHPLTSTTYYMAFYVTTPFLGAIAGMLGMMDETRITSLLESAALGTIVATFLTWIVVDSITGSAELLMPQPRKHRAQRLTEAKLQKQQEKANREQLLTYILEEERENESKWERALAPQASRLASLLAAEDADRTAAEQEAITIAAQAWRMGGLNCMRQLRNMTIDAFRRQSNERQFVDYISAWWDGVGNWRNPSPAAA